LSDELGLLAGDFRKGGRQVIVRLQQIGPQPERSFEMWNGFRCAAGRVGQQPAKVVLRIGRLALPNCLRSPR
jgi:hypothetical protein